IPLMLQRGAIGGERMMRMKARWRVALAAVPVVLAILSAQSGPASSERLWQLRNLGKAFYENPTTQAQAVDQFRQALALAPNSPREIVNYGLSLLRAGKVPEGITQLEKAQKLDPKLPHTWFNLGITWKKQGEFDRSMEQLLGMAKLIP